MWSCHAAGGFTLLLLLSRLGTLSFWRTWVTWSSILERPLFVSGYPTEDATVAWTSSKRVSNRFLKRSFKAWAWLGINIMRERKKLVDAYWLTLYLADANVLVGSSNICSIPIDVCVFFLFTLDTKFVGCTSRGHTGGRSHRISSSTFLLRCMPLFLSSTVKSICVYWRLNHSPTCWAFLFFISIFYFILVRKN